MPINSSKLICVFTPSREPRRARGRPPPSPWRSRPQRRLSRHHWSTASTFAFLRGPQLWRVQRRRPLQFRAAPQSQTPLVELASLGAAQRAASGQAAALGLLASGDLKIHGDGCLDQLVHFKPRSAPRRVVAAAAALGAALLAAEFTPWVPDRDDALHVAGLRCAVHDRAPQAPLPAMRQGLLQPLRAPPASTSARAATARRLAPRRTAERTPPLLRRCHQVYRPLRPPQRAAPRTLYRGGALHDRVARTGSVAGPRRRVARRRVVGAAAAVHAVGGWRPFRRAVVRYAAVGQACAVLLLKIGATHLRSRGRSTSAQAAIWELSHRVCARYILDTVTTLGGFWVKLAQGASVVSALPDAYTAELSKLQDAMPPDPLSEVESVLRDELGAGWRQLIVALEPVPIGSATIAQVHRATLRVGAPTSRRCSRCSTAGLARDWRSTSRRQRCSLCSSAPSRAPLPRAQAGGARSGDHARRARLYAGGEQPAACSAEPRRLGPPRRVPA